MRFVRLKHVKSYAIGGKVYWYHRLTKERLPDDEDARAKRVIEINATLDGWRPGVIPGSIGDVITRYKASPEFTGLAAKTRKSYLAQLTRLERGFANDPITNIDVAWLHKIRDTMARKRGPRSADVMLAVLSILLGFAVARGYRKDNPARHVKKLRRSKPYEPWPEVAIERFRADANPRMVWAVELAIYTGQRQSDVLAMQWRHIEHGMIEVAQDKTDERLSIPIHPDLVEVLAGIPRRGVTIVHREDGRAYTPDGFRSVFHREKQRLGLSALQFHGLRHTAGHRLAEAGATDREIMAILGHRTATMVTRYTRKAEQKRLAQAAIVKLESRRKRSHD